MRPVVRAPTSAGTSRSGPLVTITTRVPSGRSMAPGACRASQNATQVTQPEERNPSRVRRSLFATATARASPAGVTPATVGASPRPGVPAVGPIATGAGPAGPGGSSTADAGSPTPTSSSWSDRRMSAWLRRSPATKMPSPRTTNVDTTMRAITPPPFPISTQYPRGWAARGGPPRARGHGVGHTPDVSTDDLFLPEPEPREVRYTVISVDDHVVEPAHTFEGRLPAALQDRAPRIVETELGHQVWEFEGERYTQVGMNAVAGRRPETVRLEPFRFDQMRRGCYDADARVHDMDINGVWASVNFPSMITGFCGRVFFDAKERELGLACIRAWNDWLFEEWYTPHPERIVPLGITYLADPELAADEIRRNAARGFTSVTFPERPHA